MAVVLLGTGTLPDPLEMLLTLTYISVATRVRIIPNCHKNYTLPNQH